MKSVYSVFGGVLLKRNESEKRKRNESSVLAWLCSGGSVLELMYDDAGCLWIWLLAGRITVFFGLASNV